MHQAVKAHIEEDRLDKFMFLPGSAEMADLKCL